MGFAVITNPVSHETAGFTTGQFRRLDDLYCRAASAKTLTYRTVECDFDEGVASYTYYQSAHHAPAFQFVIRRVGPRETMYELYAQNRGRIAKSGVFLKAFEKLQSEINELSV